MKINNKLIIVIIASLFIGVMIGYFTFDFINNRKKIIKKDSSLSFSDDIQIRSAGYKFINPLLDCDNFNPSSVKSLNKIKRELNSYIDKLKDGKTLLDISVYIRILNDGPWIGINEKNIYTPASLLKVPVMIACFKRAESDLGFLKEKIQYSNSSYAQTIMDTNMLQIGAYYSVETLIDKMLIFSDNASMELLVNKIGDPFFFKVMADIGVDIQNRNLKTDYVTVKEYSSFFRVLYNATYLNKEFSEKGLEILSRTYYKKGIPRYLPGDVLVAHKFGEMGYAHTDIKQLHDCGIVYRKDNPYLICIMTKGYDFDVLAGIIADLSNIVYINFED